MGVAFGQPRVAGHVGMVEEEGATPVNRLQGDGRGVGWIGGAHANAPKTIGVLAIRFGADVSTVGGTTPKVGAAGLEKDASEGAKRPDELAGIAALKSGP
jgi:hypothetical protein